MIWFLLFLAAPVLAALAIETDAFVLVLILFFVIAGLSTSHPSHDDSEEFHTDASQPERLREADSDRPLRQTDAASTLRERPARRSMTTAEV